MALKPFGDRVVIEFKERETQSAGGVLLPETLKNEEQEGTVVAVGFGCKSPLTVGQRVLYSKSAGTIIKFDGKVLLVISERDILAAV